MLVKAKDAGGLAAATAGAGLSGVFGVAKKPAASIGPGTEVRRDLCRIGIESDAQRRARTGDGLLEPVPESG